MEAATRAETLILLGILDAAIRDCEVGAAIGIEVFDHQVGGSLSSWNELGR